jgi:hypothetical protein
MRAKIREPYRVFTQDEFFAEDGRFAASRLGIDGERGPHAGKSVGRRRSAGARRVAGIAMLIGAAGAVVVVLAIDVLPHAGGSRRRGASLRVAREAAHGMSVPAQPLSRMRLPRALARQSRRGGRSARPARERVISAGPRSQAKRAPQGKAPARRPAEVSADRGEVAHEELAASNEVPVRSRPEEFGFER